MDNFDEKADEYAASWEALSKKVFTASRLMAGETSTERHESLKRFASLLPAGEAAPEYKEVSLSGEPKKEAILIPAGISFAAFGSNMSRYDAQHSGRFQVLSQIMTYGYLWEEIRVHGGAYGCGFSAGTTGNMVFTSYRDPNPQNSLRVYSQAGDFIRDFAESDEDLTKYIISSIAGMDGLISSARRGYGQELNYIRGTGYEDLLGIRKQMLETTREQLGELAGLFDKVGLDGSCCVVGNAEAISPDDSWEVYNL